MLTSIAVAGSADATDVSGPVTSSVAYGAGALTATVSDATTGGSNDRRGRVLPRRGHRAWDRYGDGCR